MARQDGVVVGEVELAWHDAPVERLHTDEAQTIAFTGVVDAKAKTAIAADGTAQRLYADAAESGAPLTMLAFRIGLAPLVDVGHHLVLIAVVLFGISTGISWCYYGERCANFLFGPRAVAPYRVVYVGMHFVGAVLPLSLAWTLGDAMLGIAVLPNLVVLWALSGEVSALSRSYFREKRWLRPRDRGR